MEDFKIILTKIREGDDRNYQTIEFNPPLEIDVYEAENGLQAELDFGLRFYVGWRSPIVEGYATIEEKVQKIIEFELFHSFFHISEDPNYGVLNWALYGNLKDRVTKDEKYQ